MNRATDVMQSMDEEAKALFDKATEDIVRLQVDCGVDIPSDGEMRRENYVHYHCRHLAGFDFSELIKTALREGAYNALSANNSWKGVSPGAVPARRLARCAGRDRPARWRSLCPVR